MGYHHREYRPPKRAREEAPCIVYPVCSTRDCHRVRSHPRALRAPSGDFVRGPSCLCGQSRGAVESLGCHWWRRTRDVVDYERASATEHARRGLDIEDREGI